MPLFVGTRRILRPVPSASGGGDTPTYVAVGTNVSLNSIESPLLSVPYYSGLAANDIGFVQIGGYVGGAGGFTFPTVSGWTLIDDQQASPGQTHQAVYWKRLTGSESGTEDFQLVTTSESNIATAVMFGIRGCVTSGTPYEDQDVASGTDASMTAATITTLGSNRLVLRIHMDADAGSSSVPASWTQRFEVVETAANAMTTALDTIAQSSAGTVSASTRTAGFAANYVIHTMAMIPT